MFCSLHTPQTQTDIVSEILKKVTALDMAIAPDGKKLMQFNYLRVKKDSKEKETIKERLANACAAFATDKEHALRLSDYISKGWFIFATPLLSNGGTTAGLPISCYLQYIQDSLKGIAETYSEMLHMSAYGGGIGTFFDLRSKGMPTSKGSETTGIIPFMKAYESLILAASQGITRRGAGAVYLDISHPEVLEFLSIRDATNGDINRKTPNLHTGICITDKFKKAVLDDLSWEFIDPNSKEVVSFIEPETNEFVSSMSARALWGKILGSRMEEKGEPYLLFVDNVKRMSPYHVDDRKDIHGSNLCIEIVELTNKDKSAVCCLSSINAEKEPEWKTNNKFIPDLVEMLDNAMEVFIRQAPPVLSRAINSSIEERSLGLGVMGIGALKQSRGDAFNTPDHDVFKHIHTQAIIASEALGYKRGIPLLARHLGRRNVHVMAIAPNASSSLMLGTSPGIEPYETNYHTIKQGRLLFLFKNPYLVEVLKQYGKDDPSIWSDISNHKGSVQHLDFLTTSEKNQFLTAREIDQHDIIELADKRQEYICQSQSLNLWFSPTEDRRYVNSVHLKALKSSSIKSLYYCLTGASSQVEAMQTSKKEEPQQACPINPIEREGCAACAD